MKLPSLKHSAARSLCLYAVAVATLPSALAQTASPAQQLITTPVIETSWVTLAGNTRPEANPNNDRGAVSDSLPLQHILLELKRPAGREAALTARIEAMHQPGNPLFHQWLTAEQIGADFGLNPSDLTAITSWMQSHGFQINSVAPSGVVIDFSGTAAQVKSAFKTELHSLSVNGATHIANMQDPQIPAALANAVAGVASLNDFRPKPANRGISAVRIDGATKAVVPQTATPADTVSTSTQLVVPDDLHTIYNFDPVYRKGITGKDQTIAVLEDTDVFSTADWDIFRSTFGLSKYKQATFTQVHPGGCTDPGDQIGNDAEAILDAEYATAAAPDARIMLAACADTQTSSGVLLAMQGLVNQLRPPSIISISYGECESALGSAGNAAYYQAYQQAAAEGVSVFAAAGDDGAAGCSPDAPNTVVGIAVSGLASTPYNVAVGGTDFSDTFSGTNAQYWKKKDNSTFGSAKSYIPEIPWNDSCASTLIANTEGFAVPYGTTGFCNSTLGLDDFLTTTAGSGGPSICGTGNPSPLIPSPANSGTCRGYAKPNYQAGAFGNPSDGVRDLPDVSLFAGNGIWGHDYVFCYSQPAVGAGGAPCTGDPSTWSGAGGTSFAAPIIAGVQALIDQSIGSPQGNPNFIYYALGKQEYRATGNNSCNSSLGSGIDGSCTFNDVTLGDNDVPCAADITFLYDCYRPSALGTAGVLSVSSTAYEKAYGTKPGWDFATGLGTVNVDNLVTNWSKAVE